MNWISHDDVQKILEFVQWYRRENHLTPAPGFKPEGSCFHNGEFVNLLYGQLILTPEYQCGWLELANSEIRAGVLCEIEKNKQFQSLHM